MRRAPCRPALLALALIACEPASSADEKKPAASPPPSRPAANSPADPLEPAITEIRQRYTRIQQDQLRYRCRKLGLDGFSAEGGELEACYEGTVLRKLTARHFGESGRAEEQYFFWDGHLDFVFRQSDRYTAPLSGEVEAREEQRFYFVGGRLVRWLGPDKVPQAVTSAEAHAEAGSLQRTARQLAACAADPALDTCEG